MSDEPADLFSAKPKIQVAVPGGYQGGRPARRPCQWCDGDIFTPDGKGGETCDTCQQQHNRYVWRVIRRNQ